MPKGKIEDLMKKRKENPYRKKYEKDPSAGRAQWYNPGALKTELGEKWFEGAEDLYNTGVVKNTQELLAMSTDQLKKSSEEASSIKSEKSWKDKAKEFLFGKPAEEKQYEQLLPEHKAYLQDYFKRLEKLAPQELQYLQSQREMPYMQRAFGEYAPYAGALGGTLLGQLAAPQASQFTSNQPGGAGMSGQLLGSLLGSLVGQQPRFQSGVRSGAEQLGQYAQTYGPQALQYGQQALQYGQQRGQSALDYLRNLMSRGA